ncbi:hypothetical protein [Micromonospora psammae]|uniref:hypothetical protein n=1 Tax=Micromonospora sp. CPCC 205556 TaxID=3122398 RepID=UPI002FF0E042
MNAHRIDQETVERLLGGPVVDPQDGPGPLVALLTAVRAAPHPDELRGESDAVQAFRAARAGLSPTVPSRPARPRALAGLAGLKVALAALAVTATGGVALAAATDTLPGPLDRSDDRPSVPSAAPGPVSPTSSRPGRSTPPSTVESPRPTPAAAILGLCRAYRADAGDNPGRTLENPVFTDLITSAGGRDKVADYCEQAVADRGGPDAPPDPTTDRPGSAPKTRPSGRASHEPARPTGAGKPSVPAPAPSTPPGPDDTPAGRRTPPGPRPR